eukprot:TRINITY_DN18111_c0_g1_i1.p1 TRINITY_DN18111_c0_g1~~TRINITY_DN18111_c0_g1_i1.p1  ORF type:complete len:595 (+),score=45.66 TRINITY_DN18111_c0_g1_i1:44-1828(+)
MHILTFRLFVLSSVLPSQDATLPFSHDDILGVVRADHHDIGEHSAEGIAKVENDTCVVQKQVSQGCRHFLIVWKVFRHRVDLSLEDCWQISLLCTLSVAEERLLSLLPLTSTDTPALLLDRWLLEAERIYEVIVKAEGERLIDDGVFRDQLNDAKDRVELLHDAFHTAREELWETPRRKWVLNSTIWNIYATRFSLFQTPPTRPHVAFCAIPTNASSNWKDVEGVMYHHRHVQNVHEDHVRKGFVQMENLMNRMMSTFVDLDWFPGFGTLIGFMRYGSVFGTLANGKVDIVDKDLDLFVILPTALSWFHFVLVFAQELENLGWYGCGIGLQYRYHNSTRLNELGGASPRGASVLLCAWMQPNSMVVLNIWWLRPVWRSLGASAQKRSINFGHLARAKLGSITLLRSTNHVLRSDVAMCSDMACGHGRTFSTYWASADLTEEAFCDLTGCWSTSSLFSYWKGRVLPSRIQWPRSPCLAWGSRLACPNGAQELLRYFNKGEYWRKTESGSVGKWPCLALPDIACTPFSATDYSWKRDRVRTLRTQRLRREGLSRQDWTILKGKIRFLAQIGCLHHNLSQCDYTMCRRDLNKFAEDF